MADEDSSNGLTDEQLGDLSALLRKRNEVDAEITQILQRPVLGGHLGEAIAAAVFDIQLHTSASQAHSDGIFRSGPHRGKEVNIKCYACQEGILDLDTTEPPDFYLVLTGPRRAAESSRGRTRPFAIDAVYLFDAAQLHQQQMERGVKIGTASSVPQALWKTAEIYPGRSSEFPLEERQRELLAAFGSAPDSPA